MEYREDLKKLSWDALYQRLRSAEDAVKSKNVKIHALRSGLKAAQDRLARLEAKPTVDPPPTWTPPKSLPDGTYACRGKSLYAANMGMCFGGPEAVRELYKDWTNPPKPGRWKVENGTATYLGE